MRAADRVQAVQKVFFIVRITNKLTRLLGQIVEHLEYSLFLNSHYSYSIICLYHIRIRVKFTFRINFSAFMERKYKKMEEIL